MTVAMVISACGGTPAEPTMNPQDIQSTAVAAAFTIIAETQAAIPTNTPVPPTDTPVPTPLPTDTPVPSPTLETIVIPTFTSPPPAPTNNTGGDPCNAPLPGSIDGAPTKIKITNQTKGKLVGSIYLNKTAFGECGWRGFNLDKFDEVTYYDLVQGCYNVSVFVTDNDGKDTKAFGYGCITGPDISIFDVYAESIVFHGP